MSEFIPGQRWVSDAEADKGLGTVIKVDGRMVTLAFLATGESRIYATQTAPLTRAIFQPGNVIVSHEGWGMVVQSIEGNDGLVTYHGVLDDGAAAELHEGDLDNFLQLNLPTDRLFSGRIDKPKWFELRYQTLLEMNRLAHSEIWGLTGVRTNLIPHQMYIAHEVANRYAPRVLLADEVGLGKTIEAGLIIHHQLLMERAQRVLIVTPGPLVHQWLVEMLRRFNLHFSVFNEERWEGLVGDGEMNPFDSEQLVLCDLEFFTQHTDRLEKALASQWDLLVVDEAHHLEWTEEDASAEYLCIELLAEMTAGVLLLTATPEQLGKAAHFARLRLLDPDRYPSLEAFIEEENDYGPVAKAVEALMSEKALPAEIKSLLDSTLVEGDNRKHLDVLANKNSTDEALSEARDALVEHMLDRHGAGRVLFRNTRSAVKGFPQRQLNPYPLPAPDEYQQIWEDDAGENNIQFLISPELGFQKIADTLWTDFDPRVPWLIEQLKAMGDEKILLIAASADTVLDLSSALRLKSGIHAAVFHEDMSIVERDRAAAFFADPEDGTQILICSEIGSEGRNFQFSRHLILFDLPFNPDLMEQRIGRLDRIGQLHDIQIHAPYLIGSPQETLFNWYQQGLSAFEHPCPAAHSVFSEVGEELDAVLFLPDEKRIAALIDKTRQRTKALNDELHAGRDRLLEYNSCRPKRAQALIDQAIDQEDPEHLFSYLERVFDCYGIDFESHSLNSWILRPGPYLETGFPGLMEEGMTITCHRKTALSNEDQHYLSWEHPMVTGAMEMTLGSEKGNTGFTAIQHPGIKPGSVLLECLYVVDTPSTKNLETRRYLPPTVMRFVIDQQGRDVADALTHERVSECKVDVDKHTVRKIAKACMDDIKRLVPVADSLADQKSPAIIDRGQNRTREMLGKEIDRLKALKLVNPNIRDDELTYLENQQAQLLAMLEKAVVRLDAVRMIVAG
ncbi:MAG TPA: RNA polymerase-associated protein RapA [Gammaproteobacteria bacterium]|nr:RNA polymerase-associated protein RapA [Gammaproteobacteria bacterium]